MLTGHLHKDFLLQPGNPLSILPQAYPVLVVSEVTADELPGTVPALTRKPLNAILAGSKGTVREPADLPLEFFRFLCFFEGIFEKKTLHVIFPSSR